MGSDEEFLMGKVSTCRKGDASAARAWMIFAKSLFPQSFRVLFQAFKMECEQHNLGESASCLVDLIKNFPNEGFLVRELRGMANSLSSEKDDFLKQIFEQLSDETKYEIMLTLKRNTPTTEERCELMLLFLKRMSEARLLQHAAEIIEALLAAEDQPEIQTPVNLFRKMLVCDALPLVLKVSVVDYKNRALFQLLQKALEFYVCCIMGFPAPQESAVRREVMASSDGSPNESWKPFLRLLEISAVRYRWSYPEMFVANFNELTMQQLLSVLKRKNKILSSLTNEKHRREELAGYEEAYFCVVMAFFYYLHHYGRFMHSRMFSDMSGVPNFILMEGICFPAEESPTSLSPDFKKTDQGFVVVSKSANTEAANMLIPSFVTAAECWELLHKHSYLMKDFKNLCKNIQLDAWPIFQDFYVNLLIYQKAHREAIDHLIRMQESSVDLAQKNRAALQLASCCNYIGDYERALKILFDVISNLPPATMYAPKASLSKWHKRYVYFMAHNNKEILQYCVSLLLNLYKCKEKIDDSYKDITVGYLLVLLQYDLEREYDMFQKCIDKIKKAKSFSFQKFFNYIIHVDILEELSNLTMQASGAINMDILLTATYPPNKQRTVTRGVNRGAKDDLKQAFINQMARCYDNLDNLLIEFFKEEQNFLLMTLNEA